jgi:hypothetical protein
VRHTGLVTSESGKVRGIGSVVLGEGTNSSSMALGALLREKSQVSLKKTRNCQNKVLVI